MNTSNSQAENPSVQFQLPDKSKKERLLHATLFELIALILCAPALALIMNKPLVTSASLTIMNAGCAMFMNIIFNTIFDHYEKKIGFTRTVKIRIMHACLFEISLLTLIVPLGAILLGISLKASFAMNVGLILFFLPYTYVYNLIYDVLRHRFYFNKYQRMSQSDSTSKII